MSSRYERTMTFVGSQEDSFYYTYVSIKAYEDDPNDVEAFTTRKKKFKKIIEQLSPGDTFVIGLEDMWDSEIEDLYIPDLLPENLLKRIQALEAEVQQLKKPTRIEQENVR